MSNCSSCEKRGWTVEDVLLRVAGSAVVLLVALDALTTTVTVSGGAGPLTRRVAELLWRGFLRLHRDCCRVG